MRLSLWWIDVDGGYRSSIQQSIVSFARGPHHREGKRSSPAGLFWLSLVFLVSAKLNTLLFVHLSTMVIAWAGTTRADYYSTAVVLIKSLYEIGRKVRFYSLPFLVFGLHICICGYW